MTEPTHYHQRIQRATERLAQLQAKELLATQRRQTKARTDARREDRRRHDQVAKLVFLAGAQTLDDSELLGALMMHVDRRHAIEVQAEARSLGDLRERRN